MTTTISPYRYVASEIGQPFEIQSVPPSSVALDTYLYKFSEIYSVTLDAAILPQLLMPTITFERINNTALVTIACDSEFDQIIYGINGSPVDLLYTAPFEISVTSTITAIAKKGGAQDSAPATEAYEFILPLPQISPLGSTIFNNTPVELSSTVENVEIFYTLDGSMPSNVESTTNFKVVDALFLVPTSTITINARAYRVGWTTPVAILTKTYTVLAIDALFPYRYVASAISAVNLLSVLPNTQAPVFQPGGATFIGSVLVTITAEPGALIYWTDDDSEILSADSRQYTAPITITQSSVLRAFAQKAGQYDSEVVQAQYEILSGEVEAPIATPIPGVYNGSITVDLSTNTPGASIYYTLDNSIPSIMSGILYNPAVGIMIDSSATIKAIALKSGMVPSAVVNLEYNIVLETQVAAPQITPNGGSYLLFVDVTLQTNTEGATIYYSLDGSIPSPLSLTSTMYNPTEPIRVEANLIIKAIATKDGLEPSLVTESSPFYIQNYQAPNLISVVNDSNSIIGGATVAEWDIVDAAGVTGFRIRYGTASGVLGYSYNITNANLRTATIHGLSNGVTYYFVVSAVYGESESAPSNERSCLVRDVHAPPTPTNFNATITGDGTGILLRWTNPPIDFDHVIIVKNKTHAPMSVHDGEIIYSGTAEETIDRDI